MIRLRLLQAATLLLLLLLQIASVEGLFNKTGCLLSKACWLSQECALKEDTSRIKTTFYLIRFDAEMNNYYDFSKCEKYLIVEPGLNEFVYEIMLSDIDKDTKVTLAFKTNMIPDKRLVCSTDKGRQIATSGSSEFVAEAESTPEMQHFFCRFSVRSRNPGSKRFYEALREKFDFADAVIVPDGGEMITIDNYNEIHFVGRIPCPPSIFASEGVDGIEHIMKPIYISYNRQYTCPANYTMSYATKRMAMKTMPATEAMFCTYGEVVMKLDSALVASAKCARPRNNLCADICEGNCTEPGLKQPWSEKGQLIFGCKLRFMILNGNKITQKNAKCSDKSTPDKHLWEGETNKGDNIGPEEIRSVKCVDDLDCNDITPFENANCQYCSNITHGKDGPRCENGNKMIMIEKKSNSRYNVTVTCDKRSGEWQLKYDGKSVKGTQAEMAKWKLGCAGTREPEKEQPAPAAASTNHMLYVGAGLGALLFILLVVLLLYYICCRQRRKKEQPKEESSKQPTPPATQPKTNESSNVEVPVSPPPVAPTSTESSEPQRYSGQRVQMINMSKEHLREIEPDDLLKEVSARDKTDSDRSKASQMSQVGGGTTEGNPTVTGRQTERTNEQSRTVANGDDTGSDVSRGRNSTAADNSQTGGGGNTPTIGDAAKRKEEKRKGPRVAFRERVSYETDPTKTRDKSSVGSMHTAPEQPPPLVDSTQPEGSTVEGKRKDEPSRLDADAARKAFGKERTRTTQNTNDQSSVAGNRSTSRATDMSKTG